MEKKDIGTREQRIRNLKNAAVLLGGFLGALLLSRVRVHGLHTPLSLGLLLGSGLAGLSPGAIVGGVVLGAIAETPVYWQGIAIALLYWGVARIVLLARKSCSLSARFLIFVLVSLVTLPISAASGVEELLYGVISIAVSVLAGLCFRRILLTVGTFPRSEVLPDAQQGAIALGIGMLLLSVSEAAFGDWSMPVMLLLLLAATAVSARGVFGAAAAILWAVMLTLYAKADPLLIGSIALGAIAATAVREKGKLFIVSAFILSGFMFQTFRTPNAFTVSAPNLLCGMLLFLLIPKDWLAFLRRYTDARPNTEKTIAAAVRRTEQRASHELERMGKLLGGFSGMFHVKPEQEDVIAKWTVQGALAICQGCEMRRLCWKDADAMQEAILAIADDAGNGKRVTPIGPIDETCRHFSDLCASILLSYRQAVNRNAVSERSVKQTGFVERQFAGAGAALCTYARQMRARTHESDRKEETIRERLKEAGITVESVELYNTDGTDTVALTVLRPLKLRHSDVRSAAEEACGTKLRCIRVAQSAQRVSFTFEQDAELHAAARVSRMLPGASVSGDATGECRIPGGRVCFALSDGMGRGKEARSESEAAIRLLFRLYHAGVQRELVYENVNRMLLAQNDAEMYATLDAVSIDLNTGEAELLKYGAPPSFLIRDGAVSTIVGEALPCGILAEAKPSVIRMTLKRNDRIVLCSDGVQDALPEGAEKAIAELRQSGSKPGEQLLKLARANGGTDDMTVMVIDVA